MFKRKYASLEGAPVDPHEKLRKDLEASGLDLCASPEGTLDRRDAIANTLELAKQVFPVDKHLALTYVKLAALAAHTKHTSSWRLAAHFQELFLVSIQKRAFADILEYTKSEHQESLEYRQLSREALAFIVKLGPDGSAEKVKATERLNALNLKQCCWGAAVRRAEFAYSLPKDGPEKPTI